MHPWVPHSHSKVNNLIRLAYPSHMFGFMMRHEFELLSSVYLRQGGIIESWKGRCLKEDGNQLQLFGPRNVVVFIVDIMVMCLVV
jgi:hypothetical protein